MLLDFIPLDDAIMKLYFALSSFDPLETSQNIGRKQSLERR